MCPVATTLAVLSHSQAEPGVGDRALLGVAHVLEDGHELVEIVAVDRAVVAQSDAAAVTGHHASVPQGFELVETGNYPTRYIVARKI